MIKNILLTTFISFQSTDVSLTCYALNTGKFIEANNIMPSSCLKIGLIKSSTVGGLVYLGEKRIKTKKGKIIYYSILSGISLYPVIYNIKQIKRA